MTYDSLLPPAGVNVVDAEPYLAKAEFMQRLQAGARIAHLADFIRLKALLEGGVGGWFLDCDSFWVRQPDPVETRWGSPAFGHVFGSMRAHSLGRLPLADFQHWSVHFLREPMDRLYLASPFFFPCW